PASCRPRRRTLPQWAGQVPAAGRFGHPLVRWRRPDARLPDPGWSGDAGGPLRGHPQRRWESEIDAVVTPGFGTAGDVRARIGSPDDANSANTAVMTAGDQVWALWEGGSPMAMDAADLSSEGFVSLRDDLKGMPFQAHPRFDSDGTIWNVGLSGDRMIVWRLNPDRSLHSAEIVALPRASYMHDFTASARHLVIVLQPWVFDHRTMPYAAQFAWRP
ncbi:hypothetical protein GMDG_08868, partial [Pseudogymnoascus destructans 20631-21]